MSDFSLQQSQVFEFLHEGHHAIRMLRFSTNQIVFEPHEPALSLFIIKSGEVRFFDVLPGGINRLIDILGPDEWFGSAAMGGLPSYGKRAVAMSDCVVWAIPARELRSEFSRNGELALHFLESMARRLQGAWSDASRLMFQDCRLRVIKALLRFAATPAARPSAEGVALHITHAQLAQAVGAARETVSLCLTDLRHMNIVRTGRNQVCFDPEDLRRLEAGQLPAPHQPTVVQGTPYQPAVAQCA